MKNILNIENKLLKANRLSAFENSDWKSGVRNKAGVYVIWSKRGNKSAQYVGETTSLIERFKDLGSWRNHTFTRKIKNKYNLNTPESIRSKINSLYEISFIEIDFGRKEIEEYLIYKWETHKHPKFNKSSPRYESAQKNA